MQQTTKRSTHLVDPEILPALAAFPNLDLDQARLAELRQAMAAMIPSLESMAVRGIIVEQFVVPADDRGPAISAIMHRPAVQEGPLPLFLHIHGGGYVLGAAAQNTPGNIRTVEEVGCIVASVEYRLAPEASGTEPVEDCYRALSWLVAEAERFGIDASRVAVGGESAGGGLAAALALLARDRGGPELCFQMLIYPMIDDRTGRNSDPHPYCGEFVWSPAANRFGWQSLLGDVQPESHQTGHVIPSRATNVAGLPKTYLSVGALDLFLEEDLEYARRLTRAGVPVELHVYPGAFHGFELAVEAGISQRSESDRRTALKRAFATQDIG